MAEKHYHDSLSQAIKIAKANGLDDKQIKPLVLLKQEMKTKCHKNSETLLKRMALGENLVHMKESWYSIRHTNDKGDITLKQECLKAEDIYILRRDGRHERELNRIELDNFLPAITNDEALELYKQSIRAEGHNLIRVHTGVSIESADSQDNIEGVDQDKPITVSSHAGMRWVQRVNQYALKDEKKAEDYRRLHVNAINEAVLDCFGLAEKVWQSDRDGITYWFNPNGNVMFVVGSNNIITLYEEDFGFTKDMNRMIVREQLKVLELAHNALLQAEVDHKNSLSTVDDEIKGINNELALLEANMALLIAKRATLNAEREQTNKEVKLARTKYDVEFDKLFKKWDV
jgi:hypothetical protein